MHQTVTTQDQARAALAAKRVVDDAQLLPAFQSPDIDRLLEMPDWQKRCTELLTYCDQLLGVYVHPETQEYHQIVKSDLSPVQLMNLATEKRSSKQPIVPVPPTPLRECYLNYMGSPQHHQYKVGILKVASGVGVRDKDLLRLSKRTAKATDEDLRRQKRTSACKRGSPLRNSVTVFSPPKEQRKPSSATAARALLS